LKGGHREAAVQKFFADAGGYREGREKHQLAWRLRQDALCQSPQWGTRGARGAAEAFWGEPLQRGDQNGAENGGAGDKNRRTAVEAELLEGESVNPNSPGGDSHSNPLERDGRAIQGHTFRRCDAGFGQELLQTNAPSPGHHDAQYEKDEQD